MKRYIRSSQGHTIDIVDNVHIYLNEDTGDIYIYTRPNGKGKMSFPDVGEAVEYIRENRSSIKCNYNRGGTL